MPYKTDIHHRRSIRLAEYDYSSEGFYFITVCIHKHRPLLGKIKEGRMHLSLVGQIVKEEFCRLTERYSFIKCHEYIVMPNHFHAIIQITDNVGAPLAGAQNRATSPMVYTQGHPQGVPLQNMTLGQIVGAFKSITTNRCAKLYDEYGKKMGKLWQRNYYEHIIRNQHSYDEIATYIIENPHHWHKDKLYVGQQGT